MGVVNTASRMSNLKRLLSEQCLDGTLIGNLTNV